MAGFGWKAGTEQYPPTELLDYAIKAEAAGFDLIDVSDHFQPWSELGQASFTWTWLGAVAARTSRIQIGPGVTCPTLRYHPAIVAQAAATLAAMAPERAFLGVGTGEALNEYAATAHWPGYSERRHRLAEAIDLIRALWTGDEISFAGTFYQTRRARLYTRPAGQVPIYISTLVPESAAFAGAHGDGMITAGGKPPQVYRQIIEQFEAGARQAGKDPAGMPRLIELRVAYTDDAKAAIQAQQQYWAGTYIPALYDQKIYTPKMSQENGMIVGQDTIRQATCISTNPDDHVRFTQQYLDLGFDRIIFHSAGPDIPAFLEAYGRDVLPRLRQAQQRRDQAA